MTSTAWRASGEVIEREELLDGRCQVVLDGEAVAGGEGEDPGGVVFALSLVWLLGREGEVPLAEGYVTVTADTGELNASLDAGSVGTSEETGAATVRASFIVDAVEGEPAASGERVSCDIEVGTESWSGELRLERAGEDA